MAIIIANDKKPSAIPPLKPIIAAMHEVLLDDVISEASTATEPTISFKQNLTMPTMVKKVHDGKKEEKDKVVKFPIYDGMTITALIKLGYQRYEVEALFEELDNKGFGQYIRGTRGKTGVAKFIANEQCPKTYEMIFKVKSLRADYAGCPEELKRNNTKEYVGVVSQSIEKIKAIPHIPAHIPDNLGTGYVCSYNDEYIFIDKISNKGFRSLEDSLDSVWDEIKDRINLKPTKYMTDKDQVVSRLKGLSYYEFKSDNEGINK